MKQAETQQRHRGQRNQTDLPVQGEHDGEHSNDLEGLREKPQNRLRKDVLQRVRVPADFGHQIARPGVIVERE